MSKPFDVMGFGEAMVRFSPMHHLRLEQASELRLAIAAAELNVAVNVSHLGLKSKYVTKMVDTWSGHFIINHGRAHGVDMSDVHLVPFDGRGHVRNGLCFVEIGVGPRPNRQIYDRGHSAVNTIEVGEFDWKKLLSQTRWFHNSGITTALTDVTIREVITSMRTARELGVTNSFDLNFRSTLWKSDAAQKVMKEVMPYVDVIIGNEEDFEKMLGIKADDTGEHYSALDPEKYRAVAEKVIKQYPHIRTVGTTLREAKTGLRNDWQTVMLHEGGFYVSRKYEDLEIVDRTGGGDSFASAVIYSLLTGQSPQYAIDLAGGYSALCHGYFGDWNWATKEEAERAAAGGAARVIR